MRQVWHTSHIFVKQAVAARDKKKIVKPERQCYYSSFMLADIPCYIRSLGVIQLFSKFV